MMSALPVKLLLASLLYQYWKWLMNERKIVQQFDDHMLEEFVLGFYGHGNLQGNYWFIGMEHGGGDSFENIKQHIDKWVDQDKEPVTDLPDYCNGIGEAYYFRKPVKNQPTWNKLIRLLLSLKGEEDISLMNVKAYQMSHWGRHDDETAALELLPLANPSLNHPWLYGVHSDLLYLASREVYRSHVMPIRVKHIQKMLAEHRPRLVHFYGDSYDEWWRQIAGVHFEQDAVEGRAFAYGQSPDTLFLITHHPVSRGVTIKYFEQIGRFLQQLL